MMKGPMTATRLRLILVSSLFVIAILEAGVFTFAYGQLSQTAIDASHTAVDASASENNLATLQKIKKTLEEEKDVVSRASSIVADSKSYQYQDQIITDLNNFANKNGVSITNVDFSGGQAPTTSGQAAAPAQTAAPAGLKSTSVTVTLKTPVNYDNLLRFVEAIEQNLTKMQISKISLSRGSATGNDITSDALTIEVYIR